MGSLTLISVVKFAVRSRVRARKGERTKRVFARISWYKTVHDGFRSDRIPQLRITKSVETPIPSASARCELLTACISPQRPLVTRRGDYAIGAFRSAVDRSCGTLQWLRRALGVWHPQAQPQQVAWSRIGSRDNLEVARAAARRESKPPVEYGRGGIS
eukprot:3717920-Prymnesium_polylepis.2